MTFPPCSQLTPDTVSFRENHLRVIEIDLRADPRWDRFVRSHADGLIYHHHGWLQALEEEYGQKCIGLACVDSGGEVRGILPLMRTIGLPFHANDNLTGRRLSSLPRTPVAGPLAASEEACALLLRDAAERARAGMAKLQIKSARLLSFASSDGLRCTQWRPTYVLEIPEYPEELRCRDARTRHNLKWGVKKAERNGITVRRAENESDILAWYPLYLQVMRRNSVPARSLRLFTAMWRHLASQGLMRLQVAERKEGSRRRLIAGSIFLTFGDTTFYAFTGIADRDLSTHANDLILWQAINDARGTGVRKVDFGEVAEDHPELARFKTKWGARPEEQYRYYSDEPSTKYEHSSMYRNNAVKLISRIWQRLPLGITQRLGDMIYGRL